MADGGILEVSSVEGADPILGSCAQVATEIALDLEASVSGFIKRLDELSEKCRAQALENGALKAQVERLKTVLAKLPIPASDYAEVWRLLYGDRAAERAKANGLDN